MRGLKRIALIFVVTMLCFVIIIGFVSLMYPWSRVSVFRYFRYLPESVVLKVPKPIMTFALKRVVFKSAKLQGFRIRWIKIAGVKEVTLSDDAIIYLESIDKPFKRGSLVWGAQYAQVEALKVDDGITLWTRTIPNPLWEKGLSTNWKLLTWQQNEIWVIALNAGQINALDIHTGKLLWKHDFGFPIWGIKQGKQVVFLIHGEGILCFEPKAKRILWEIRNENSRIESRVIDCWLQVFVNPYGSKPAYTRWFSLEDGRPIEHRPEVKRQKREEIPKCVKQRLKCYKEVDIEAGIVGQKDGLFLIGAEVGTERLIAVDAKSGKVRWEVRTEISAAHCCGHNYQIAFVDKLLFYCVNSNHDSEGSQLLVVEVETGKVVAKAEWIEPFEGRREAIGIFRVENREVIVASGFWACKLELVAK